MTLNTYLRWTAIASVFAVFLVPFLVADSLFFPFITGKNFYFRVIVEIGFAAWLLLALRDAAYRPRKSWVLWAFLAFVAIIGVADIFGVNPWKSFWSNFERMEGYVTTLHLFAYFLVASSVLATEKLWQRFLQWSVGSSALVSLYGILQIAGKATINQGGVRVDATFGNATYLAIYLIFNIFFAVILAARESATVLQRYVWGAIAALNTYVLYHTATRGSILGLIGGALLTALIIALFDKAERRRRIVAASVVGAVVVLVLGFVAIKDSKFVANSLVLQRFAGISWNETKTQARSYIWPMAIEGWKERPILGWGQENFNYIFNANYNPKMYNQEQWFDHTHNIVLDWLVAGGILGVLAYLSLFVTALWLIWRRSTDASFTEKALLTGLMAAYFFHNLFVFDNIVSLVLFASFLSFVHFRATRLEKPIGADAEAFDESDTKMAGPLVLAALVVALYFFNWRGYATASTLIDGLRAGTALPAQASAVLDSFEKAYGYGTLGRAEVVERIVETASRMNAADIPLETRQRFADLGKRAVEEQLRRSPGDARYEMFAGTYYAIYGDAVTAEKHLLEANRLSPNKQSMLMQLGNFYNATKQHDKAIAAFKRAAELEPSYVEAWRYYAVALVYAGRDEEARQLLIEKTGEANMAGDPFLSAYAALGKWDKVVSTLRARIAAYPSNMTDRQNLVAAYLELGDRQGAITAIRELIAVNPAFKEVGEQYIKQIQTGVLK